MKPTVTKLSGTHLTATDKRNILAVIEYLRDKDPATYSTLYSGAARSPKSYSLCPDPIIPDVYSVMIRQNYRTDRGEPRTRESGYLVKVDNIDPLPIPKSFVTDMIEAGK